MTMRCYLSLLVLLGAVNSAEAGPMVYFGISTDGSIDTARASFQQEVASQGGTLQQEGVNVSFPGEPPAKTFTLPGNGLLDVIENSKSEHVVSTNESKYVTEGTRAIRMSINNPSEYEFVFDSPKNAFGVDISDVDVDSGTLSIVDNLGNSLLSFTFDEVVHGEPPIDIFFGLINNEAYNTIRVTATGNPNKSFGGFIGFDDLEFGVAPESLDTPPTPAPVGTPEPASLLAWLACGLVAGWFVVNRRRSLSAR